MIDDRLMTNWLHNDDSCLLRVCHKAVQRFVCFKSYTNDIDVDIRFKSRSCGSFKRKTCQILVSLMEKFYFKDQKRIVIFVFKKCNELILQLIAFVMFKNILGTTTISVLKRGASHT